MVGSFSWHEYTIMVLIQREGRDRENRKNFGGFSPFSPSLDKLIHNESTMNILFLKEDHEKVLFVLVIVSLLVAPVLPRAARRSSEADRPATRRQPADRISDRSR